MEVFPDRLSIDGGVTYINATPGGLDLSTAVYGDWEWNNKNNEIKFLGELLYKFDSLLIHMELFALLVISGCSEKKGFALPGNKVFL